MSELKIVETEQFGKIKYDENKNRYIVPTEKVFEILEQNGLPEAKKVMDALSSASGELQKKMAHFVAEKANETMRDCYMTAGTMPYRYDASTILSKDVNIPGRDGQPCARKTLYGVTSVSKHEKTPTFIKQDEHLRELSNTIEQKFLAKKNDTSIKVA